jgi:hypothetical protein
MVSYCCLSSWATGDYEVCKEMPCVHKRPQLVPTRINTFQWIISPKPAAGFLFILRLWQCVDCTAPSGTMTGEQSGIEKEMVLALTELVSRHLCKTEENHGSLSRDGHYFGLDSNREPPDSHSEAVPLDNCCKICVSVCAICVCISSVHCPGNTVLNV